MRPKPAASEPKSTVIRGDKLLDNEDTRQLVKVMRLWMPSLRARLACFEKKATNEDDRRRYEREIKAVDDMDEMHRFSDLRKEVALPSGVILASIDGSWTMGSGSAALELNGLDHVLAGEIYHQHQLTRRTFAGYPSLESLIVGKLEAWNALVGGGPSSSWVAVAPPPQLTMAAVIRDPASSVVEYRIEVGEQGYKRRVKAFLKSTEHGYWEMCPHAAPDCPVRRLSRLSAGLADALMVQTDLDISRPNEVEMPCVLAGEVRRLSEVRQATESNPGIHY